MSGLTPGFARSSDTYYRVIAFGEVTLTDGVEERIRGEQELASLYDSSAES
ncbi:hypothetical protein [Halobellus rubicundus]|uniref:Uncharacterized protein n=1 Tax=Halobellus rubicundus TaxID=2996466 RepID=A0ABD5MH57_9EURY